ncbi:MAG: VOC family protein [Saprospiraceae bacterium]|nr:VOC family protein [Saprospiraceae bacterium]
MKESIYPCLWFDGKSHEAADYYCSIFPDSRILNKTPMVCVFELGGRKMMHLNGGPEFTFNESISFVISCESQEEIDYYWSALTSNGREGKCGWLTDKYGVSWQVVPSILGGLMSDPEKAPKVMYAFMQMKKFDIQKLMDSAL